MPGVIVQDDPAAARLPAGDRGRRTRRDLRRAGSGAIRRSRATAASPSGSCRTTCARARRPTPSSSPRSCTSVAGSVRRRIAAPDRIALRTPPRPRRDRQRAPDGARGHRRRGPGLHELPSARDADPSRAGRRRPGDRGRLRRRRPGLQRGSPGPAVHRAGRGPPRQAACFDRMAAPGRVHHQRREMPAARQPGSAARRDRRLRAVPAASARGARPGGHRHPRSLLDGDVHAGRPDLAGARDRPAGRSRHGRSLGHRLRDVSPGSRAPDAGHRARELRRHRRSPGHAARFTSKAAKRPVARGRSGADAHRTSNPTPEPRHDARVRQPPPTTSHPN